MSERGEKDWEKLKKGELRRRSLFIPFGTADTDKHTHTYTHIYTLLHTQVHGTVRVKTHEIE